MLENLSENIRDCYRHAEDCERQAKLQTDPALRQDFLDMAARWTRLAESYGFAQRISDFTASRSKWRPSPNTASLAKSAGRLADKLSNPNTSGRRS